MSHLFFSTLFLAANAGSGGPEIASMVVRLPAAAQLYVDDHPVRQTGERRILHTPPLQPGYVYAFTLKMELQVNDQFFRAIKRVEFRPGETVRVNFAPPDEVTPAASKTQATTTLTASESELLRLTNQERKDAGLPPLTIDATLMRAARDHSANMARQGKMDHVLNEKTPTDRLQTLGYRGFTLGENIAYGMPTSAGAITVWMNSEGHRANILNEQFTEIGIGIISDDRGVPYYTQVFGRRLRSP